MHKKKKIIESKIIWKKSSWMLFIGETTGHRKTDWPADTFQLILELHRVHRDGWCSSFLTIPL